MVVQIRERPESVIKLFLLKAVRSWYSGVAYSRKVGRSHPIVLLAICHLRNANRLEGRPSVQEFSSGCNGHNPVLLDDDGHNSLADSSLHGAHCEPAHVFAAAALENVAMQHFGPFRTKLLASYIDSSLAPTRQSVSTSI